MEENSDKRTALSAGLVIYEALSEDSNVRDRVKAIYPVLSDSAELPCIYYRRASLTGIPVKDGAPARGAEIEIYCLSSDYAESVEIAEAVRACFENQQIWGTCGLYVRNCVLADAVEDWQDDTFIQSLIFNLSI